MMKLHFAAASPFARKVLVCAKLRGIEGQIELVATNPHVSPADLLAANPLSKIPALVLEDGSAVFDSRVICEYLDGIGAAPGLFPADPAQRVKALTMQALADGIGDAAVGRRLAAGPSDPQRDNFIARQKAAVARALAHAEASPPEGLSDIGAVALACALGYLDLRYADEPWRAAHPKLAAWFETVSAVPAIASTVPKG